MIVDKDGDEIENKPPTHKFGQFLIPPNCHIKGFNGIVGEGSTGRGTVRIQVRKDDVRLRAQRKE